MTQPFLNDSGTIGVIIATGTELTGSLFITILIITMLLLALSMMFRLPIEYTVPILLPIFLVSMAYSTEFLAIGGMMLIYLSVLFAKNFWLN